MSWHERIVAACMNYGAAAAFAGAAIAHGRDINGSLDAETEAFKKVLRLIAEKDGC